jgi:hypothetical protein
MNRGASGPALPRQKLRERNQKKRLGMKGYPQRNICTRLSRGGADLDENGGLRLGENQHVGSFSALLPTTFLSLVGDDSQAELISVPLTQDVTSSVFELSTL